MKQFYNFADLLLETKEYPTPENIELLKRAVETFNANIGYNKTGATNLQEVAQMAVESRKAREAQGK